jgi:para-nitrobenzyl esterase
MNRTHLALGLVAFAFAASAAIPEPVKLDSGLVSGTAGSSAGMRIYKGIPFAAPPVGPLRWKAPQPAAKWEGVRKAEQFSPRCMQAQRPGAEPVSEDCLYLNIWTGAVNASEKRPVMVWTYGGGFTGGAGSEPRYDGEELARKGVIIVTLNYRLGPFGFLAHPELTKESGHKASGNYGMMDFIAALRWVQKNIAAFGGDPSNVTIMGESAGAIMVGASVGSPEAKGLFVRAIAESGAYMGMTMGHTATLASAEAVGAKAGTLAELRAKSADEIQKSVTANGLVVDGWIIPEDLNTRFAKTRQNDVDVMMGSNKDEGTFFQRGTTADAFIKEAKAKYGAQAEQFLKLYPAGSDAEATASSLAAFRDEVAWNMQLWAKLTAKKGRKAYVYYFTQEPPVTAGQPSRGATHVAEIPYVFHHPAPNWTAADEKVSQQMATAWVAFATKGAPWPENAGRPYMVFGPAPKAGEAPDAAKLAFFDSIYAKQ